MADTELAWAAGFFDGEGSTYATKPDARYQRKTCYVRMRAAQKHREPLDRLQAAVGAGTVTGPDKRGMYVWQVQSKAVYEVKEKLWPYLSSIKRAQFEAAQEAATQRSLVG